VDGDEEAAVGVATAANVDVDGHGFVMADLGVVVPVRRVLCRTRCREGGIREVGRMGSWE